jgi:hypothetical protein
MAHYRNTYSVKREKWEGGELIVLEDYYTSYADALNAVYNTRKHSFHSIKIHDEEGRLVYSMQDYCDENPYA